MRIRAIIGTGLAAAVAATAGMTLIPLAASAQPTPAATHTYKFTSITQKEIDASSSAADADYDYVGSKLSGFDTTWGKYNPKTKKIDVDVTVTTTGGILYATVSGAPSASMFTGPVTGGVGTFANAKGTITGKNLNKAGTKTAVTITYTTSGS